MCTKYSIRGSHMWSCMRVVIGDWNMGEGVAKLVDCVSTQSLPGLRAGDAQPHIVS